MRPRLLAALLFSVGAAAYAGVMSDLFGGFAPPPKPSDPAPQPMWMAVVPAVLAAALAATLLARALSRDASSHRVAVRGLAAGVIVTAAAYALHSLYVTWNSVAHFTQSGEGLWAATTYSLGVSATLFLPFILTAGPVGAVAGLAFYVVEGRARGNV